ncbi:MAG: formamidopyrimidine-DNA glycosylase [Phycisphaerae bacterium]|nr:formamidopyrimidine-DNA glycosylase [Phycisphaerae bacterium]
MPELPDVAVFGQYINATALHRNIVRATASDARVVMGDSLKALQRKLKADALDSTARHGKYLGVRLASGRCLVLHFGMTGNIKYLKVNGDPPKYSKLVLQFEDHYQLAYINKRRLGRIQLVEDWDAFLGGASLGPDALQIKKSDFIQLLTVGKGSVKTRLMNQNVLAGLGNVYTDETLFQSGIHPATHVSRITRARASDIWRTMRHVLRTAIDRKADPNSLPDSWLTPQRGENQCPCCKGKLRRTKVSGRTSVFCPHCQHK